MRETQEYGSKAEQLFKEELECYNISYKYLNDWSDFIIENKVYLDVKSCQISHKFTNKNINYQCYKIGRFELTEEQRKNCIYLALYVHWDMKFIFIGIIKSEKNSPKYISIHKLREKKIFNIEEFKDLI